MKHMRSIIRSTLLLGLLLCTAARLAAQAPPGAPVPAVTTLASGQTGRIGFETVTLTSTQFLMGVKDGPSTVIWGELRLPSEGAGRLPAVILVLGSDGVGAREARWAEELDRIGVATFVLDSFTGRGHLRPFDPATLPSPLAMIVDAYRVLALLATHPRIDPGQIALMGFSRGGAVALYASLTRFQRMHGPAGVEFAAYLPFYPGCTTTYIDDEQVSNRPIRLFHGTADDWLPLARCQEYADRLRRAGKDVHLTPYPGARHAFDRPDLPPVRSLPKTLSWTRCVFIERPEGEVVSRDTGRPRDRNDPCFTAGVTIGYDPHAHSEAVRAVHAFLTATFKRSQ